VISEPRVLTPLTRKDRTVNWEHVQLFTTYPPKVHYIFRTVNWEHVQPFTTYPPKVHYIFILTHYRYSNWTSSFTTSTIILHVFVYLLIMRRPCITRDGISAGLPGNRDKDSLVVIATRYGLDDPGIESRWWRYFPHPSRPAVGPTQPPVKLVIPGGKAVGMWH
jgi:hypothetical protein